MWSEWLLQVRKKQRFLKVAENLLRNINSKDICKATGVAVLRLSEARLLMFLWWELHMKCYRNKIYGVSLAQIDVLVSEI